MVVATPSVEWNSGVLFPFYGICTVPEQSLKVLEFRILKLPGLDSRGKRLWLWKAPEKSVK